MIDFTFMAYQPNQGIHISSFFMTKQEEGRTPNWAKTSSMHWCLGAISAGPLGMCSRPRTSTLMPQTTSRPTTPRLQKANMASVQRVGPRKSGVQPTATKAVQR